RRGREESNTGKSKQTEAPSKTFSGPTALEKISGQTCDLGKCSRLLVKLGVEYAVDDSKLAGSYVSQQDVSYYVSAALDDAKNMAQESTKQAFDVCHESSLWSDRPDHIVLFEKGTTNPILAVVYKKPFRYGENTPILGPVLRQVFDCMMELRSLGHSAPFVVLTTFDSSWMFWENEEYSNRLVQQENKLEYIAKLQLTSPSRAAISSESQTVSYEEEFSKFGASSRDNMYQTGSYESKDIVRLLYTAILCGLARNPTAPSDNQIIPKEAFVGTALKLTEKEYSWGHAELKVDKPIMEVASGSTASQPKLQRSFNNTFFAIERIGRGYTSEVFSAYDHKGKFCVIKMYVRHEDANEQGQQICLAEVERLKQFYDFLEGKVFYQVLNNVPCIVMPYFRPLSKDEQKSLAEQEKSDLQDCLLNFKKFRYSDCDLRWRHIGYYCGQKDGKELKKLVMFDLADLQEVQEEITPKEVAQLVETLQQCL
ncbi:MAG: hypothetical protein SGILL_007426, partial [Bacillariaceae sp.]